MNMLIRHWRLAALALICLIAIPSCAYYDPYYSSTVGASYSSGYGYGYGYGGSSFTTSIMVGTGDPRWGYDPYCYSYYDYRRRCYYDPYLYGYYPIGYRPPVVVGCPHPGGWRPGRGYCPPPRHVRDTRVPDYKNRVNGYRRSSHGWAKQVRQAPQSRGRASSQRSGNNSNVRANPASRSTMNRGNFGRTNAGSRPSGQSINQRPQSRPAPSVNRTPQRRTSPSGSSNARLPSNYNRPVTTRQSANRQATPASRSQARGSSQQQRSRAQQPARRQSAPRAAPQRQPSRAPAANPNPGRNARPSGGRSRSMRGLGQG